MPSALKNLKNFKRARVFLFGSFLVIFSLYLLPLRALASLSYEIPYTLDNNQNGLILCDIPPYNNVIHFRSYRIGKSGPGSSLLNGTTFGNGPCTGSLNASLGPGGNFDPANGQGLDGTPSIYYLTLYLGSNYTDPYGYMAFNCTLSSCTPHRETPLPTGFGAWDSFSIINPTPPISISCSNSSEPRYFMTKENFDLISPDYVYDATNENLHIINGNPLCTGTLTITEEPTGDYVFFDGSDIGANRIIIERVQFLHFDTGTDTLSTPNTTCTTNCFSNVLFLPGIQGSRLYRDRLKCGDALGGSECGEKQLWLSNSEIYQTDLALTTEGKSTHNDIYTKNDTQVENLGEAETGIIDEAFGTINIYKSFLDDLEHWKSTDSIINDYAFIPYDWRLSLEDVISNGQAGVNGELSYTEDQNFSESFILQKLRELQADSRTGKVTLIGHSNGGLVIKALVKKLQETNDPLYEKIDKIILVATPQVGAPEATIALLHGIKLAGGFLMDADTNRMLAENMPTVYNLNPSASYFTTVDTNIDPLITFENKPQFADQIAEYGYSIDTFAELKDYVLGGDGRLKPAFEDTKNPNIGNATLFSEAENVHQILDNWTPHPDTKIIQVAGWGEETTVGLQYVTKKKFLGGEYVSYKPKKVIDGDRTVPVPSALWMSDNNPNVERWWVDLVRYNNKKLINIEIFRTQHKDILEVLNLQDFIKSKITNEVLFADEDNIIVSNTSTLLSNGVRLHYTLHSPLTLGITDSEGNYTGLDPETGETKFEIPNVTYEQIGDVQFISTPEGVPYTLKVHGYEEGSFALDVEKQIGNEIVVSTSFEGIPSSTSTIATMDIPENFEVNTSELKIDSNGDNIVDKTLEANPGGITVYDTTPPEISMAFNLNINEVEFKGLDENPVTTIHSNTNTTATDEQGNTTILSYTKYKEKPTRLKLKFNTINRNGIVTTLPNTHVTYDWDTKDGDIIDLDTKVFIKGVEKYVFNYKKKQNVTVIKIKTGDTITTTTKTGFIGVTIKTSGDEVLVNY